MAESALELAKRFIEQERLWDDVLYLGGSSAVQDRLPAAIASASAPAPVIGGIAVPTKTQKLQSLHEQYQDCVRCPLGATRIKFVFGVGNPEARVMFIGEGPGYEEDRRGEPFVGKAGQLLDKIMGAIGLSRENVYIANIVKCHPMQNPETPEARGNDRAPNAIEVETCSPILLQQIATIQPAFIVTLGSPSTRMMLQTTEGITKMRGRFFPFPVEGFFAAHDSAASATGAGPLTLDGPTRQILSQTKILPTYHPAALLRNPDLKADVWTDMKRLREALQTTVF
jgi:DNA polymerase